MWAEQGKVPQCSGTALGEYTATIPDGRSLADGGGDQALGLTDVQDL